MFLIPVKDYYHLIKSLLCTWKHLRTSTSSRHRAILSSHYSCLCPQLLTLFGGGRVADQVYLPLFAENSCLMRLVREQRLKQTVNQNYELKEAKTLHLYLYYFDRMINIFFARVFFILFFNYWWCVSFYFFFYFILFFAVYFSYMPQRCLTS